MHRVLTFLGKTARQAPELANIAARNARASRDMAQMGARSRHALRAVTRSGSTPPRLLAEFPAQYAGMRVFSRAQQLAPLSSSAYTRSQQWAGQGGRPGLPSVTPWALLAAGATAVAGWLGLSSTEEAQPVEEAPNETQAAEALSVEDELTAAILPGIEGYLEIAPQLALLEEAIFETLQIGKVSFRVLRTDNGIETIQEITRHEKAEDYPGKVRHNLDYFREYMVELKQLLSQVSPEFTANHLQKVVDSAAEKGLASFLGVLQDEFGAKEQIEKNPLATLILSNPNRHVIEAMVNEFQVYRIRPEHGELPLWLWEQMIIEEAEKAVKDPKREARIEDLRGEGFLDPECGLAEELSYLREMYRARTKASQRFKYMAMIHADKPEQLDEYYATLRKESERLGKPVTGICVLGAAHYTVTYITVDADKKDVRLFYKDSFGEVQGTERDTQFWPSAIRQFEEKGYTVTNWHDKQAIQRGSSMGCSVHALFYAMVLREIGDWLGETYPGLLETPVDERLYEYLKATDIDGDIESRASYQTEEDLKADKYDFKTKKRLTRFARSPFILAATHQAPLAEGDNEKETIIYYNPDKPDEWEYLTDPVTLERTVTEQQGILVQENAHRAGNSAYAREFNVEYPHPFYRGKSLDELLDEWVVHDGSAATNSGIHLIAARMRAELVQRLHRADSVDIWRLSQKLSSPHAKYSPAAMRRHLDPTTGPFCSLLEHTYAKIEGFKQLLLEERATRQANAKPQAPMAPRIPVGQDSEQSAEYLITHGPTLESDVVKAYAELCLKHDNIPGLYALLWRYPNELPQSFLENEMLAHSNLAKLAYDLTRPYPRERPPQVENILDEDMGNGKVTFLASNDIEQIKRVTQQIKQMPKGWEQVVAVVMNHEGYWDAEVALWKVSSRGKGEMTTIPINDTARKAVSAPGTPTFDQMMDNPSSANRVDDRQGLERRPPFVIREDGPRAPIFGPFGLRFNPTLFVPARFGIPEAAMNPDSRAHVDTEELPHQSSCKR